MLVGRNCAEGGVSKCPAHPERDAESFVVLFERPILHRYWEGSVCRECLKKALEMLANSVGVGPKMLVQRMGEEPV